MSFLPMNNDKSTGVISSALGKLFLDNVVEESHQSELVTTDNPVENGSTVSDHSFLKPKTVTIRGIIVNYEPATRDIEYIGKVPVPAPESIVNAVISDNYQPLTEDVQRIVSNKLSVLSSSSSVARKLAPWLPGGVSNAFDLTGGSTGNRIATQLESLEELQRSGALINITTEAKSYVDMQITSLASITKKNTLLEVVIGAKQLIISAPQTVTATGLTGGEADYTIKNGKGNGKDGDANSEPGGKEGEEKAKKVKHQSVTERMRGQVNAEKAKLKRRLGY